MKKIWFAAVLVSLFLVSCSKDEPDGQEEWLTNLEEAVSKAKTENKNIVLLVTAQEDGYSADLMNDIFYRRSFVNRMTAGSVLVNFDFSKDIIQSAVDAGDDELLSKIDRNMLDASLYGIDMTPTVLILSKDGYFITQIFLTSHTNSPDEFNVLYEQALPQIEAFTARTDLIASSAGTEKLAAIDALYEATPEEYRPLLHNLCDEYVSADAANSTGKCSKYLLSSCDYNGRYQLFQHNYEAAAQLYEKTAENAFLTPLEKQETYYQSGFLLASLGYTDYEKLKLIFKKSLDAAPDSGNAATIKQMISIVENQLKNTLSDLVKEN